MGARLLAAAVGLAIVLPILYVGGGWVTLLVGFVVCVAMDEWAGMTAGTGDDAPRRRRRGRMVLVPVGLLLFLALAHGPEAARIPALAVAGMVALLVPMFAEPDVPRAGDEAMKNLAGLAYAPVMLVPLLLLRGRDDGLLMIVYLLAVTWLGDTGAYFAGRFFGKTKLFERISPKKTLEGAVGGLIVSALGGAAIAHQAGLPFAFAEAFVLSALLDVAGVVGDLAESLLKRAWGVKDSGWIMPGHGGILDRIDSLQIGRASCRERV